MGSSEREKPTSSGTNRIDFSQNKKERKGKGKDKKMKEREKKEGKKEGEKVRKSEKRRFIKAVGLWNGLSRDFEWSLMVLHGQRHCPAPLLLGGYFLSFKLPSPSQYLGLEDNKHVVNMDTGNKKRLLSLSWSFVSSLAPYGSTSLRFNADLDHFKRFCFSSNHLNDSELDNQYPWYRVFHWKCFRNLHFIGFV